MPISRHTQNIFKSPTHSATISVSSVHPAASRARVALMGNVTVFREIENTPELEAIQSCYIEKHPDARHWVPGPREPHIVSTASILRVCAIRGWNKPTLFRHIGHALIFMYVAVAICIMLHNSRAHPVSLMCRAFISLVDSAARTT